MRIATLVLVIVIALLQWPLWVGKGSWLTVWHLQDQLEQQKKNNQILAARNDSLTAEVNNLKTGYDAVEERARSELGLIKQDEVFFQVLKPDAMTPYRPPGAAAPGAPALGTTAPGAGAARIEPAGAGNPAAGMPVASIPQAVTP